METGRNERTPNAKKGKNKPAGQSNERKNSQHEKDQIGNGGGRGGRGGESEQLQKKQKTMLNVVYLNARSLSRKLPDLEILAADK